MKINRRMEQLLETTRSLMMHKFRSFLSILGIIFGVAAFISMLAVGEGAKREAIRQIELLGTKNIIVRAARLSESARVEAAETLSPGLTYADAGRLEQSGLFATNVAATRDIEADVLVSRKALNVSVAGTVPAFLAANNLKMYSGSFLNDLDLNNRNRVCVIGAEAARKIFGHIQSALNKSILINDDWYRVKGVIRSKAAPGKKFAVISHRQVNNQIYIPLTNAMAVKSSNHRGRDNISELIVSSDNSEAVPKYAAVVRSILDKAHRGVADYELIVPQELLQHAEKSQRIFNIVLGAIAAISLLVGGIGIMNIMLATISERTAEIGIRRAVGACRRDIMNQFLAETLVLTISGGVIGILFGFVLAKVIAVYADWDTIVSIKNSIISLLVSVAVGVFFGIYPAYKASRMNPIEALRYE